MYISGAKFEEHYFNISGDILDWVLFCFGETTYDVMWECGDLWKLTASSVIWFLFL